MLLLTVALCLPLAHERGAQSQPAPRTLTTRQDYQLMLEQLKIPASAMRRGPSGFDRNAPDYQNVDEAKAIAKSYGDRPIVRRNHAHHSFAPWRDVARVEAMRDGKNGSATTTLVCGHVLTDLGRSKIDRAEASKKRRCASLRALTSPPRPRAVRTDR